MKVREVRTTLKVRKNTYLPSMAITDSEVRLYPYQLEMPPLEFAITDSHREVRLYPYHLKHE